LSWRVTVSRKARLSQTDAGKDWLLQFPSGDQLTAQKLLDGLILVSTDRFRTALSNLVRKRRPSEQTIALFVEREVEGPPGNPASFFPTDRDRYYNRPAMLKPRRGGTLVGSEGLVAQLISEFAEDPSGRFKIHPDIEMMRRAKVKRIAIVTDLIGSGDRVYRQLDSIWKREKSIRSWWSYDKIHFEVIAYATTHDGRSTIESHPCAPRVHAVASCSRVETKWAAKRAAEIRTLCKHYNPPPQPGDDERMGPLGYRDVGTLIVFGHKCPNTAPRILWTAGGRNRWRPLFPHGIATKLDEELSQARDRGSIGELLIELRQKRLSTSAWFEAVKPHAREVVLFLACLSSRRRDTDAIADRTGLTYHQIETIGKLAGKAGWVDGSSRLTSDGYALLERLRAEKGSQGLSFPDIGYYYPQSLRAPILPSS
jgi:hypothetical protein